MQGSGAGQIMRINYPVCTFKFILDRNIYARNIYGSSRRMRALFSLLK